jgi:hypothetical protein
MREQPAGHQSPRAVVNEAVHDRRTAAGNDGDVDMIVTSTHSSRRESEPTIRNQLSSLKAEDSYAHVADTTLAMDRIVDFSPLEPRIMLR